MSLQESVGAPAGRHERETKTDERKEEQRRLCVTEKKDVDSVCYT